MQKIEPTFHFKNKQNANLKRCFDFSLATVGFLAGLPMFLLVALLVKISSKGPIFFRQKRITIGVKQFEIMKFRTMYVDFDKRGLGVQIQGNSAAITPIGRWLRKTKLDEIPQLLNIICGEMSFVGPRPELPRRLEKYSPEDLVVFSVRSGISSPASVALADEEQLMNLVRDPERFYMEQLLPLKVKMNKAYILKANFVTDMFIILATVGKVCGLDLFKSRIFISELDLVRQNLEKVALEYR